MTKIRPRWAVRQAVNKWIRTSGAFYGVFGFDAGVRDPDRPERFGDDLQTGDYLHPNAAGYKAMAAVINLSLLRGGAGSITEQNRITKSERAFRASQAIRGGRP